MKTAKNKNTQGRKPNTGNTKLSKAGLFLKNGGSSGKILDMKAVMK